jgi:dTDP-glucose pyrophosphorylase
MKSEPVSSNAGLHALSQIVIPERATIRDAMKAIDAGAVAIALVTDKNGRLVGTLSDGDVRRAILKGATLDAKAVIYANRKFTAVGTAASRAEVLDLMRARVLEQIPILDDSGLLIGLHLLREILGATPRPNWAVIMAGGRGERLRPITDSIPKPMIRVAGRPILERIVLHLVGHGFRRIFISVNYKAEIIRDHFGNGTGFGCRIEYLTEEAPLGTGGPISLLPAQPEHPVLVLNGDLITQLDVGGMLCSHVDRVNKVTVAVREYLHTIPFGVIELENERVVALTEKPTNSWLANAGVYVLSPDLVSRVPKSKYFQLPALVEQCLEKGERVGVFHIEDDWIDVGQHNELRRARGEESNL